MFPLRPSEKFQVVYNIADANDSNTYYVRSVLRNSKTGDIIATYDLTDAGNGRFYKEVTAPVDPTNQGLYFDVTTTVYEDSGYTTKSSSYQQENRQYIVDYRRAGSFGAPFGGSPGGPDYTLGEITKSVSSAITPVFLNRINEFEDKVLKGSQTVKTAPVSNSSNDKTIASLQAILEALKGIQSTVAGVQNTKTVEIVKEYPMMDYIDKIETIVSEMKPQDITPEVNELISLVGYLADKIELMQKSKMFDETFVKSTVTEAVRSILPSVVTGQLQNVFSAVVDASKTMTEQAPEDPRIQARKQRANKTLQALNMTPANA